MRNPKLEIIQSLNKAVGVDLTPPIHHVLARLDGVYKTTSHQWIAKCPAHDDKNPSLSVKEDTSGQVLLNCHAGCNTLDVVSAMGLRWTDLFQPTLDQELKAHFRERLSRRDYLKILQHHAFMLGFGASELLADKAFTRDDAKELARAAERVAYALNNLLGENHATH